MPLMNLANTMLTGYHAEDAPAWARLQLRIMQYEILLWYLHLAAGLQWNVYMAMGLNVCLYPPSKLPTLKIM